MAIEYDSTADEIQFSGKPNYAEFDLLATSTDASVSFADGYQFKLTKDIRLLGVNAPGVLWSRNALNNKSWSSQQTLYIKVDGGEWQGVVFAAGTSYTPSTIATLINSSTNGVTATANVATKGTYLSIKSDYDFTQSGADPADSWVEINSTEAVREYFGWEDYQRAVGTAGCDLSDFGNVIINPNAKQIWIDDGVVDAKWRDVTFIESGPRLSATRKLFQGSDENSGNDNTRYIAEGGGYCHTPEGSDSSGDYKTRIDIEAVANVRIWANEIAQQEVNEVLVRKSSELNGITAAPKVQSIGVDGRNASGQGGHIRARFRDLVCSSGLQRNGTRLNAFWGASVMFEGLVNTALNPLATDLRWLNTYRGSGTTDQYVYFLGTAEAFARARGYTSNDIQNRVTYLHLIGGAIHYHKVGGGEGAKARYYDSRQDGPARHIPTLENTLMLKAATVQDIGSDEQIQVVVHSWTVDTDSTPSWTREDITGQRLVITKYDKNVISFDIEDTRTNIGRHDNFAPLPMTDDESITESTAATVRGYSELDTAAKMYDALKELLVHYFDNFGDGDALFCTRAGDVIDFGSRDISLTNGPTYTINTIRNQTTTQFTAISNRGVQVGDIIFVSGTTHHNGRQRVTSLTGTLAFNTDIAFGGNETSAGTYVILARAPKVTAASGTLMIYTGDDFTGSIQTTGTASVASGVSVSGFVKDSAGVSVVFTGLPAGKSGVAAAWPSSQGATNRANAITGAVADATATSIKLTLALNTSYHFVLDALGYRRSAVGTIDTTSQLTATAAVEEIVNATGQPLIPDSLSTDEQAEADLITWGADYIDIAADEVGEVTPAVGATMTGTETENFDVDGLNLRVVSQTYGTGGSISGTTVNTNFIGNGRTAAQVAASLNTSFTFANAGMTASASGGAVVLTRDDAGVSHGFYIHDNSTAATVLGFITGSANGVVGVDEIPAPRTPVDATPSFNSLSYEIERGQSTEAAQTSLINPARIEQGRIIFPAMSDQKWRRKAAEVHVPDIEAISIGKDGSADASDFVDFSNGGIKYKTEPPVNIVLSGGSLLPQSDFDARMSGVADSIKDTYKAADATISQSDFDALMLAVPYATKVQYQANVINQANFDNRMENLREDIKNQFKGSALSASEILSAIATSFFANIYKDSWASGNRYDVGDIVLHDDKFYICKVFQDSSPTAPDMDSTRWGSYWVDVPQVPKLMSIIGQSLFGGRGPSNSGAWVGKWKATFTYRADEIVYDDSIGGVEQIYRCIERIPASANNGRYPGLSISAGESYWQKIDVADLVKILLEASTDDNGLTAIKTAAGTAISQADFDARMLAVPETTKDGYKGTGSGGSGDISQTLFNTRMANVPDATKDTYKGSGGGGTAPTVAEIVAGIKAEDFGNATGTQTLGDLFQALATAVGDLTIPTVAQIVTGVEASATDTAVDTIKTQLEDATNGLAAIKTAIGNLTAPASVSAIVAGIQAADFGSDSDTQTLQTVLAGLLSAINSLSIPTVAEIVAGAQSSTDANGLAAIKTAIGNIDPPTVTEIAAGVPTAIEVRDAVFANAIATGIDLTKAVELLMAVLFGTAAVSGNTVSFSNTAGSVVCRVTVGTDGQRTNLEIV